MTLAQPTGGVVFPRLVFTSETALGAFESTTGVRLRQSREPLRFKLFLRTHPVGRKLPRVEVFESTPGAERRFGGAFCVRVWERDDPDEGTQDGGLQLHEVERGPDAGASHPAATAKRSNVEVMFWPAALEVTAEAQLAWSALTAFLSRLE
jgi:hypothetical protein